MARVTATSSGVLHDHLKAAVNSALKDKAIIVTLSLDHKVFPNTKIISGVVSMTVRTTGHDKHTRHFPLTTWEVGGKNEKDADANFKALKNCVEEFFEEENRNKLGFQGDQAVVNQNWLNKVKNFHAFGVVSGQCAFHGGHVAKTRGNKRLLVTINLDEHFNRAKIHNEDDFDHSFWFNGEKHHWEESLKKFFSFLAHLQVKPNTTVISFGSAIYHYLLKIQKRCSDDVNPYRNMDRERRMEKLFGEGYKIKEKESSEKLLQHSDKKKRKIDEQIDQLGNSLQPALTIARSKDYKELFPGIEEFEFPTEFIKYINEYGVENRKLLSIMDSTNHGQDSGLFRQLCFSTEMMIDFDGYPLDNALSR